MTFRGIVAGSRANATCVGGSSGLFRQAVQTTLSLQQPQRNARISCVHDVAIVRHNNEGVAPVPACLTQQSQYVSCVLVV